MFKVATRYLNGVSLFLGDDITKRNIDGEIAVFIGQATKGPSAPIQLKSPDNAIAIYGAENPLVKALFQFNDGYLDSPKLQDIKYVTLRVGGIAASLATSYGLVLETSDAYSNIEDDYYVFVDDTSSDSAKIKIWDNNKLIVFDSAKAIDTGHFTVSSLPTGTSGKLYGTEIDNDPLGTPLTLSELVKLDIVKKGATFLSPASSGGITTSDISVTVVEDVSLYQLTGTLVITETLGALTHREYVGYTLDKTSKTFTFTNSAKVATAFSVNAKIGVVGTILVKGDSQLDLTQKELYEKFRNDLLEVEAYTPDYIVPGGINFGKTETFVKVYTETTQLINAVTEANTTITVDAAATWPVIGSVKLFNGINEADVAYTAITPSGSDYVLTLSLPAFTIASVASDKLSAILTGTGNLGVKGFIKLTHLSTPTTYAYTLDAVVANKINFSSEISASLVAGDTAVVVPGAFLTTETLVSTSFNQTENFELGIGYVKEIDKGDHFEFQWSTVKQSGYYLADFAYLLAKFCSDASVGYNTPMSAMNVEVPFTTAPTRSQLVSWIGTIPQYVIQAGTTDTIQAIVSNGTGLLGNAILAGSKTYNRCYLSDPSQNDFADPAYGLLLTDQGFVDGSEIKDDYSNLVDLGKYMCVGAGLLTFSNQASASQYIDACGVYALGMLAGKPKNEGISFTKIGSGSNTVVSVIANRSLYNSLARFGYIVPSRENGLGWVINNDESVARSQSAYFLISTTRTIKYVMEAKRKILVSFIGKPVNTYFYEAAKTRLAESYTADVANGMLNGFSFDLQIIETAKAIGKFLLNTSLNPPLELVSADINAVIDRDLKG